MSAQSLTASGVGMAAMATMALIAAGVCSAATGGPTAAGFQRNGPDLTGAGVHSRVERSAQALPPRLKYLTMQIPDPVASVDVEAGPVWGLLGALVAGVSLTFALGLCASCVERKGSRARGGRTVDNVAVIAAFNDAVGGQRGQPPGRGSELASSTSSEMLGAMTSIPGGMGVEELNESMLETALPGNGVAPSADETKLLELRGDAKVLGRLVGAKTSGEMFNELNLLKKRITALEQGLSRRSSKASQGLSDPADSLPDGYLHVITDEEPLVDIDGDVDMDKLPSARETKVLIRGILDDRKTAADQRRLDRVAQKAAAAADRLATIMAQLMAFYAKHAPGQKTEEELKAVAEQCRADGTESINGSLKKSYGESFDEFVARSATLNRAAKSTKHAWEYQACMRASVNLADHAADTDADNATTITRDRSNSVYGFDAPGPTASAAIEDYLRETAPNTPMMSELPLGPRGRSGSIVSTYGFDGPAEVEVLQAR